MPADFADHLIGPLTHRQLMVQDQFLRLRFRRQPPQIHTGGVEGRVIPLPLRRSFREPGRGVHFVHQDVDPAAARATSAL